MIGGVRYVLADVRALCTPFPLNIAHIFLCTHILYHFKGYGSVPSQSLVDIWFGIAQVARGWIGT